MTQVTDRQYVLSAVADVTVETAAAVTIDVPVNAMIVGMHYSVVTAATGTSPTLTLKDDLASPNTYLSAVSISSAANGVGASGEVGNFYPSGATLVFTTGGSTPAGGRILVSVEYVIVGRGNENYGQ